MSRGGAAPGRLNPDLDEGLCLRAVPVQVVAAELDGIGEQRGARRARLMASQPIRR